MLNKVGKFAAVVAIAGGAYLSNPNDVIGAEACTQQDEEFMQCTTPAGQVCDQQGDDFWCTVNYNCHITYNHEGRKVNWTHDCLYNGPYECPVTQPCG